MEGIKLDKRQFGWLNDNDAFFLFQKDLKYMYDGMTEENKILFGLDGYAEFLNEQLFTVYQHVLVTKDNSLFGWDGFSYHEIGNDLQDIYETAKGIL